MYRSNKGFATLLLVFIIWSQPGCSGTQPQKASEAVPDTKVLEPVKEAVEKAEEEMERRQEAEERQQEETIEAYFEEASKLSDHAYSLRESNDWEGHLKALDRLIELQLKALHYAEKEGLERERGRAHHRLGRAYEKRGRMKKAEEQYKKALELATGDSEREHCYSNLFELYQRTSRFEEALELVPIAANLASEPDDQSKWSLAPAELAMKQKQFDSAEKTVRAYLQTVENQDSREALEAQQECYELLIDIAWEREDREAAAKLRVARSELSLRLAKRRLREVQGDS